MPMISAAISWSRMAMKARPIRLRIRFCVPTNARMTKNVRNRYICQALVSFVPNTEGGPT